MSEKKSGDEGCAAAILVTLIVLGLTLLGGFFWGRSVGHGEGRKEGREVGYEDGWSNSAAKWTDAADSPPHLRLWRDQWYWVLKVKDGDIKPPVPGKKE